MLPDSVDPVAGRNAVPDGVREEKRANDEPEVAPWARVWDLVVVQARPGVSSHERRIGGGRMTDRSLKPATSETHFLLAKRGWTVSSSEGVLVCTHKDGTTFVVTNAFVPSPGFNRDQLIDRMALSLVHAVGGQVTPKRIARGPGPSETSSVAGVDDGSASQDPGRTTRPT